MGTFRNVKRPKGQKMPHGAKYRNFGYRNMVFGK